MTRLTVTISMILLAGFSTACGFHLQDQTELPQAMSNTVLQVQNPYSTFARRLTILLEQNGASFVETGPATARLEIPVNEVRKEILTIGDNARVREYRVRHTVTFRLVDVDGNLLVADHTFEQSRVISFDEQDILAAAEEEEFLRQNMADTLSRLVIRHLGSSGS